MVGLTEVRLGVVGESGLTPHDFLAAALKTPPGKPVDSPLREPALRRRLDGRRLWDGAAAPPTSRPGDHRMEAMEKKDGFRYPFPQYGISPQDVARRQGVSFTRRKPPQAA